MTFFFFPLNRQHTLVYIPSLDKFYFFGSGDEGQLEDERKPNQLIPLPINSPVNTGESCQSNDHCRCIQSVFVSSMEMFAFLISCLHWKANIMSHACLAIPTNPTRSYSICCLIIMGRSLIESNFQQITTIWRGFLLFHFCVLNSLKKITVSSNVPMTIFLFFHRKGCTKKRDQNYCRSTQKFCPSRGEQGMCTFDHSFWFYHCPHY